jgi:hypothetical protein
MNLEEISRDESELNSPALGSFAAVVRKVAIDAMNPRPLMAAPLGPKNGGADPPRKSVKFNFPPLPNPLVDAVADAALERLPAMQQQLLDEGVVSAPILPGPVVLPYLAEVIPCKMQLRLRLGSEGREGPSHTFFDCDPSGKFSRLVVLNLNLDNTAVRSALGRRNISAVRFFAGVALAKCLLRSDRSALLRALLAQVKTCAGVAPNEQIATTAFARRLADSALMEPIKDLPIFGHASQDATGRSFALAEIDASIPTIELGPPWNQSPSKRRDPPNNGIR